MNPVIVSTSLARFPREACGFVLASGRAIEVDNVSEDVTGFRLEEQAATFWWITGEVVAVWHSHPFDPAIPSEADERLAHPELECWIYSVTDEQLGVYRPDGQGRLQLVRMEED